MMTTIHIPMTAAAVSYVNGANAKNTPTHECMMTYGDRNGEAAMD
jgi:hypothetical protein